MTQIRTHTFRTEREARTFESETRSNSRRPWGERFIRTPARENPLLVYPDTNTAAWVVETEEHRG